MRSFMDHITLSSLRIIIHSHSMHPLRTLTQPPSLLLRKLPLNQLSTIHIVPVREIEDPKVGVLVKAVGNTNA